MVEDEVDGEGAGLGVGALRNQYTSYDATYLALAEGLGVPVVTCDKKLNAGGHHATVVVYPNHSP